MSAISDTQRTILTLLTQGHRIAYSQDGDNAWLVPTHPTGILDVNAMIGLHEQMLIEDEPRSEEEEYRFAPCSVISTKGLNVLQQEASI